MCCLHACLLQFGPLNLNRVYVQLPASECLLRELLRGVARVHLVESIRNGLCVCVCRSKHPETLWNIKHLHTRAEATDTTNCDGVRKSLREYVVFHTILIYLLSSYWLSVVCYHICTFVRSKYQQIKCITPLYRTGDKYRIVNVLDEKKAKKKTEEITHAQRKRKYRY